MNSGKFYLGVDGGGTKTIGVVCDEKGLVKAVSYSGSINYNSVGFDEARKNMKKINDDLLEKTGIESFDSAFIGMAAILERATDEETEKFCNGVIKGKKIAMDSDLYIGLESMVTDEPRAMVISGTGSMTVGINEKGKVIHKGGWGHLLGDEGSGYAIATDALKAGICGFENSARKTMLTDKILEFYQLDDMYNLIDIYYDPPMPRSETAKFTPAFFECVRAGDKVAVEIMKNHSSLLANTTIALLKELPEKIKIGVWGGVMKNNKEFFDDFKAHIDNYKAGYTVEILDYPPEIGAVFAAMKEDGLRIDENILSNIRKEYLK